MSAAAIGAAIGFFGAASASRRRNQEARDAMAAINKRVANTYGVIDQREQEEQMNLRNIIEKVSDNAMVEQGRILALAGASGLTGLSQQRAEAVGAVKFAEDAGTATENTRRQLVQLEREKYGVYQQGVSQVTQVANNVPSSLDSILSGVTAGIQGFSMGQDISKAFKNLKTENIFGGTNG